MTNLGLRDTNTDMPEPDRVLDAHIQHLLVAVEHELRETQGGLSELELIKALQRPPWSLIGEVSFHRPEALYPVHFLLFHVLYRLRDQVAESGEQLDISPLAIRLTKQDTVAGTGLPDGVDSLRQFYLDLSQYEMSEAVIHQMMDNFWAGRSAGQPARADVVAAAETLGFDKVPAEFQQVKRRFRRAVMQAHPDRGGETETIQRLNQAFSLLKAHFRALPHP
ncbi:DNA-J related domain-containing protein [Marinobacter nitratireducens]|uniref:DNA-J related domain-containing protein n=1 Tax=Marinobacter nitratireducens TaxID=1137280 RepID=UPI00056BA1C2|nr:DNA-J related domain-containing protein [Marinobacter nitratireducens]